jgi:maltooligosyltrehalose trehalohydrolase
MARGDDGWWRASAPDAAPDYAFQLDDEPAELPDPRSRWQPDGVHARSRLYDHSAFQWTDSGWTGRQLPGGVVYELHIGTFTPEGTFDAAVGKLDHLVDLGIDFVEVLPVNAFDGQYGWGYDGVLWYATQDSYGGPDGFKRFVDACHARGLAVLLDVVYNHLGPSGAYLDKFGPYFAGQTIWGPTLNLDGAQSDEVRRYVIDNALGWLRDFHVDGLRLDAVHALSDRRATHLLEELASEVDALSAHLRRPLTLIAESDLNDPRLVTPREAGGYGLHAQWSDDLHHCLHTTLSGERQGYYADFGSLQALAATLTGVFFHAGTWSSFRGRHHGRPVDTLTASGHRFLAYLQNHDQIGNRATGDRLSATVSPGLLACGAAIVLCSPYTPMIFMGEEWAASTPWQFFASFPDPELADAVRTGRRSEFADHGWDAEDVPDPMDPATFERSKLRWAEVDASGHAEVLATYRALIALRRARPELSDPRLHRLSVDVDEERRVVVLHRGDLRVVCNLGTGQVETPGAVLFSSAAPGAPESVTIVEVVA